MNSNNEFDLSIAGRGLGYDLEPSMEDWQQLVQITQKFIGQQLDGQAERDIVDATVETADDPLNRFLTDIFSEGFNPAHPGFMAYIPGGGLVTSALADWIIKSLNRYGTAYFAAPKLADLELEVIRTFARWVGYGESAGGVLTTGGSVANFTAMVTARRARLPEDFLDGVIYCSDQAHHSVMKAANLAGFSARNLRILPSDENYRFRPELLQHQIDEDITAGFQPFLVVASAGTTNTGSIDPLRELGAISRRNGLWYHVDAAYGGAFVLTGRGRDRLRGMEEADSITLDPHKGLFLPYGTGSIVVKDREALVEAHEMRGDYMPDLDRERAHLDPFSLSLELSREHRGLKMWLPLVLHGEAAFGSALDEKLDLISVVEERLSGYADMDILNQPDLSTIAFRLKGAGDATNRKLLDTIIAGGRTYISGTVLNGHFALRVSILSHRTHRPQVDEFFAELDRALTQVAV